MTKPFAISLENASSLHNLTGSWRTSRPVYSDHLPPCNGACPAGEGIQSWLSRAEEGDYRGAWEQLVRDNPLPAIMGRACYHPCEGACHRGRIDQAVSVHSVERFLGDLAIRERWSFASATSSGKRVLVIGAGPSGLSAAYHLRRLGHEVEVREAEARPGGMMRYGIPRYRLPREVLDAEVARIEAMGVALRCGSKVEDIPGSIERERFDACFVAIGAHLAHRVDIPAPDASRLVDALRLLRATESGEAPRLGRRVVVYGGGNTALDAARTVKRLGAEEAIVIYRRTRAQMPAHDFELQEALEEGIQMRWLSTIQRLDMQGGITVERMRLDEQGRAQPTGELEHLDVDCVVLAIGQVVDSSVLTGLPGVKVNSDGTVAVDDDFHTGAPGIFAGGDMVPAERSISVAVGHGKKAALAIDAIVRGTKRVPLPVLAPATFERLNPWYYSDAPRSIQPHLEAARRASSFSEVVSGLDEATAQFEARRCLSCGTCFECDNCYGVCPDNAVIKLGPGNRFRFNLDFCKGCGLCAQECPCGAIDMIPEEI